MKLQLTLGSDSPRGGALAPFLKLALVGAVALLVMNRSDIRRYLRLRRM
ncbi:MAG TPA: hypothetical protein VE953_13770 [Terriglobales bacterium]|nr:hypothetical protein [Terriglobales bacterium]